MKIILPFPPRELNPNTIKHWRKKAEFKKNYFKEGFFAAEQMMTKNPEMKFDLNRTYSITLNFYPPRATGDLDNMLAAMKSGLDGIAKALRIDDRQFRPITIDIPAKSQTNPRVEIRISQ